MPSRLWPAWLEIPNPWVPEWPAKHILEVLVTRKDTHCEITQYSYALRTTLGYTFPTKTDDAAESSPPQRIPLEFSRGSGEFPTA